MVRSGDYEGFSPIAIMIGYTEGDPPEHEEAVTWAEGLELSYRVLADVENEVLGDWVDTRWFPAYVLDRSGRIRWTGDDGTYEMADVQEMVEELLAE
jgi:hypothetical protein